MEITLASVDLNLAFLRLEPKDFVVYFPPIKNDKFLDLENWKGCYKQTIPVRGWLIPANDWAEWVDRVAFEKQGEWESTGITM